MRPLFKWSLVVLLICCISHCMDCWCWNGWLYVTADHMPNLIIWKSLIKIHGFPIRQYVIVPILRKCYFQNIKIVFTTVVFVIRTHPNYWLIIQLNDNKAKNRYARQTVANIGIDSHKTMYVRRIGCGYLL